MVKISNDETVASSKYDEYAMNMRNYQKSYDVNVKSCVQQRQQIDQGSTLEVVFDGSQTDIKYKTAGNCAIYAENQDKHVELFAKKMGYNLD